MYTCTYQSNPAAKDVSITGEINFAEVRIKYSVLCLLCIVYNIKSSHVLYNIPFCLNLPQFIIFDHFNQQPLLLIIVLHIKHVQVNTSRPQEISNIQLYMLSKCCTNIMYPYNYNMRLSIQHYTSKKHA